MATAFGLTMLWIILYGKPYVDSDMASEMVYANLLNEEGKWISSNWWFSTQVRIFDVHVFYRFGLLLFPTNWYAARVFGQALWMVALLVSYLYLCAPNGLNLRYHGAWGAACLACPFGVFYLWYGFFGGFYTPHMIIVLLSLGLIVRITREGSVWTHVLQGGELVIISLVAGMQGPKELMILYLPLMLASMVLLIVQLHCVPNQIPHRELRLCGGSFMALIVGVVGYAINTGILSKIYVFATYQRYWNDFHLLSIFDYWGQFLTLLGWQYPYQNWQTEFPLFSETGIMGGCGYVMAVILLIALWRLVAHWRELRFEGLFIITVFLSACLVQGSVFAYTRGDGGANATYWLPILPVVFVLFQLACETEHFHWRYSRRLCAIGLLLCIAGAGVSSVRTFMIFPKRAEVSLMPVCNWLVENGYTQGYASFWNANVMTEWTNGDVDVWVSEDESFANIYQWLQRADHLDPPQGKFFVLSTGRDNYVDAFDNAEIVYSDDNGYIVMAFDNYEELLQTLKAE